MTFSRTRRARMRRTRFCEDFVDITQFPELVDSLYDRVEWMIEKKPNFVTAFHSTLVNFPFSAGALDLVTDLASKDIEILYLGNERSGHSL